MLARAEGVGLQASGAVRCEYPECGCNVERAAECPANAKPGHKPEKSAFEQRLREFELSLQSRIKEFPCAVHLCLGQEQVPAALHRHLRETDWLFSTHRSHGHYLAKGGAEGALLAELEGRAEGINGGFSGSQSFCDPKLRFHSTAIVGGLVGAATGVALALKIDASPDIVVCCVGDAATEQGVFWESLNFAALHRLPILYIIENNRYSVHAPIEERQAVGIGHRMKAFGVYLWPSDKLDVALMRQAMLPAAIEVDCSRDCAHVSAMEDLRT